MKNYIDHLTRVGDSNVSKKRKIDYIKYNYSKYIDFSKKPEVLEIGPGIGAMVSFLNSNGIENIDIIDNDNSVINYIKKNYKIRYDFNTTDISKVDKIIKKYDLIFMLQVFEHIPRDQYKKVLSTLVRHLKIGGKIIIMVPNGGNPLNMLERYHDLQHENAFTEDSLKELEQYCEMKNVGLETFSYSIPTYNILNIFRVILQKILHTIIIALIIINGGVYQYIMTPNISLIITKKK